MRNGHAITKALISRRGFIFGLGLTALGAYVWRPRAHRPTFSLDGANSELGHLLRTGAHRQFPLLPNESSAQVAIIGGGIAGLAAAWRLQQAGVTDVVLIELESEVGGNASSRSNAISAFPLGAHYLPVPTKESVKVRELLEELGLIQGFDAEGRPYYDERHLLHAPQYRLYRYGDWQEGILPTVATSEEDHLQYARFFALMEEYADAQGSDGRPAFSIPVDLSSSDPVYRDLDTRTMSDFLAERGFTSEPLLWYINYCCRDDFGTPVEQTSAWAGIHYFAARKPYYANDTSADLFTWPEGNGWLVKRLKERLSTRFITGTMVSGVKSQRDGYQLELINTGEKTRSHFHAQQLIFAAPRFLYPFLSGEQGHRYLKDFEYSPWLVANITVHDAEAEIAEMPWDAVSYHSRSLGCVLSSHQNTPKAIRQSAVLTWYKPLDETSPQEARSTYLARSPASLGEEVLADVFTYYPKLRSKVGHVHLWLWGHAMIKPRPGFIWGQARQDALADANGIVFAHSDMSGISIFEEAFYRGTNAAERVVERLHG